MCAFISVSLSLLHAHVYVCTSMRVCCCCCFLPFFVGTKYIEWKCDLVECLVFCKHLISRATQLHIALYAGIALRLFSLYLQVKWCNSNFDRMYFVDKCACARVVCFWVWVCVLSAFCCLCNKKIGISATNDDRRLFTWIGIVVFHSTIVVQRVVYCCTDLGFLSFFLPFFISFFCISLYDANSLHQMQ